MLLRKARRTLVRKKVLVVATIVTLAASAGVAYAVGTDIWIGTSGNDTINLSTDTNNTHIWGLAGSDTLTGGKAVNQIVGDGNCGTNFKVPTKVTSDSYCQFVYADTFPQTDLLYGGTGPNVIYDGGDITYTMAGTATKGAGGPYNTGNVIYGSPGVDVINATAGGTSTIYPGKGGEGIDTVNGNVDYIVCQPGDGLTGILADKKDVIINPQDCGLIVTKSTRRASAASASSWTAARADRWLATEVGYIHAIGKSKSRATQRRVFARLKAEIKAITGVTYVKRA
jgi:hypothetical protein